MDILGPLRCAKLQPGPSIKGCGNPPEARLSSSRENWRERCGRNTLSIRKAVRFAPNTQIAQGAVQSTLWDDIRTADPSHMRIAFQQRRQQIVGDCKQLKTDVDSYNENGNPDEPIQLELNFTQDIAELEALEALERWDGFTDASAQPPPSSRSRDVVPV